MNTTSIKDRLEAIDLCWFAVGEQEPTCRKVVGVREDTEHSVYTLIFRGLGKEEGCTGGYVLQQEAAMHLANFGWCYISHNDTCIDTHSIDNLRRILERVQRESECTETLNEDNSSHQIVGGTGQGDDVEITLHGTLSQPIEEFHEVCHNENTTTTSDTSMEALSENLTKKEEEMEESEKSLPHQCAVLLNCLVAVEWVGYRSMVGWQNYDVSPILMNIETWGLLVNIGEDCIVVAHSLSEQDFEHNLPAQVKETTIIPLASIKSIQPMNYIIEENV